MAEAVRCSSEAGYTWIKYHTTPFQNVLQQTVAMQEVAPPGFKVYYDLNGGRTTDDILRLIQELARFPIAGMVEDVMDARDLEGYRLRRRKSPLPLLLHDIAFDGMRELIAEAADGYILKSDGFMFGSVVNKGIFGYNE